MVNTSDAFWVNDKIFWHVYDYSNVSGVFEWISGFGLFVP